MVLAVAATLAMVVASMLALLGWEFGATEALMVIVLIGFSVDYALHVGEAFRHVTEPRVEQTFALVGGAVLCAAATTAGSAFFLLFCQIALLNRFGKGILLCTAYSLLYSLVFFPASLAVLHRHC